MTTTSTGVSAVVCPRCQERDADEVALLREAPGNPTAVIVFLMSMLISGVIGFLAGIYGGTRVGPEIFALGLWMGLSCVGIGIIIGKRRPR